MNPVTLLRSEVEPLPAWLAAFRPGDPFPRDAFFSSRIVYYPGSGHDGHPLKLFGAAHAAHCFVFSDYFRPAGEYEAHLQDPNSREHPRGYEPVIVRYLRDTEFITRYGWEYLHEFRKRMAGPARGLCCPLDSRGCFAIWAVLERREGWDASHGPERIAILVVGAEAIATYDALFCQRRPTVPFGVVLQDHGFGGNWTTFGGEASPLWALANNFGSPRWLLVGDRNTPPWPGYNVASDPDHGGMHNSPRRLYRIAEDSR